MSPCATTQLAIQLHSPALLTGPVIALRPVWAICCQGLAEGIVFSQLTYLAKKNGSLDPLKPAVRISYRALQRHLPFLSRRWLIEVVARLQRSNAIVIVRAGRVNTYLINALCTKGDVPEHLYAAMLIFPTLARQVGVLDALFLQQIHLRHHDCDGKYWVIRSYERWQQEVFPFVGLATIKRTILRLKRQDLIYVRHRYSEVGTVNEYRVNYLRVAEALGIPPPVWISPPQLECGKEPHTNPLYPIQSLECEAPSKSADQSFTPLHQSSNITASILHH